MTRERAIEVLKAWDLNWSDEFTANEFEQAFALAISALSENKCFDGMTNGEVIQALFPNSKFTKMGYGNIEFAVDGFVFELTDRWLNVPYKAESEDT